jgi:hypothetical protein
VRWISAGRNLSKEAKDIVEIHHQEMTSDVCSELQIF